MRGKVRKIVWIFLVEKRVNWQPIETAPKDGSCVLLLSRAYGATDGEVEYPQPAKCHIGKWNAEGTSWTDALGSFEEEICMLSTTGIWESGGGWFQPNEVTHWMPLPAPPSGRSERLAAKMADKEYRDSYVATFGRNFLARQMRGLRGDLSQEDFARKLGAHQSSISRLENPASGVTLETLFGIAAKTDTALLVRFVTHADFIAATDDQSEAAISPAPYSQESRGSDDQAHDP
jgi:transcriptional regulator with XRE-family HTH domain